MRIRITSIHGRNTYFDAMMIYDRLQEGIIDFV